MRIRAEQPDDHDAVRDLQTAAFGEHGASVAPLVDDLRSLVVAGQGLSLVADDEGMLLGHVMFTRSLLDAPAELVAVQVLSPLAVAPPHQRQGVGGALIRHGLEMLADRGVPLVFLEGSPDYYPRFGFRPGGPMGFRKPSLRIPDAAFQAIRLPKAQPWMTGTLVYSEIFWRHDCVGLRDPVRPTTDRSTR